MKGQQKSEEYLKINPAGQVPFIKDGEFGLSESNAILKYLCNTNPSVPEHFWPKEDKARALTDQFLEYYQCHFRPALIGPHLLRIMKLRGIDYTPEAMEAALNNMYATLDTLELYLGKHEGAFIVNDKPTIADLQIFYDYTNVFYNKIDPLQPERYP